MLEVAQRLKIVVQPPHLQQAAGQRACHHSHHPEAEAVGEGDWQLCIVFKWT